ncbi:MAG: T9SS type A sorting domain-containing protein [Flavobacteriales bacterium]
MFERERMITGSCIRAVGLALLLVSSGQAMAGGGTRPGAVTVECTRSSSFIRIDIINHRKIGNVTIEVRDASGRSLYYEEGKAMTEELVRRLDKGVFPKGTAVLTVTARDLRITQQFTIQ